MKRFTLLGICLTFILAGCDVDDPVGTQPESVDAILYAEAVADIQAVPTVVEHQMPRAGLEPTASGIPLALMTMGRTSIVNGSFETGDFGGWTTATTGAPFRPWQVTGAGDGGGFGMAQTEPQDGDFVAWNGFDGGGPMDFVAYQDVEVGMGIPTLRWMDRAQWVFSFGPVTQPRTAAVQVLDPVTDAVLETLYSFSTGTAPGIGDTGWQQHMADLSAYRGETVRIAFRQTIPEAFTGPAQYELDAVSFGKQASGGAKLLQSAEVLNPGKSTPAGLCTFAGRVADRATFVRTPRGGGKLSCHWDDFAFAAPLEDALVLKDRSCFLAFGGVTTTTTDGRFILTPAKTATFSCTFENLV